MALGAAVGKEKTVGCAFMRVKKIAPHRKPCQQFTYRYVRKSYIH